MIGFPESIPCLSHSSSLCLVSLPLSLSIYYYICCGCICMYLCIRRYCTVFLRGSVLSCCLFRPTPPLYTYKMCDLCFPCVSLFRGGAVAGADAAAAVRGPDADSSGLFGGPPGFEAAAPPVRAVGPVLANWPLLAPEPRHSPELFPGAWCD